MALPLKLKCCEVESPYPQRGVLLQAGADTNVSGWNELSGGCSKLARQDTAQLPGHTGCVWIH